MNLLHLFGLVLKYKLPFIDKNACSKEIKQMFSNGGSVWQKFAQTLSLNGELIGEELATDLKTLCYQCPEHDHDYSARIIRDAFGDNYDTKRMEIVGSGTISQVYKTRIRQSGRMVAIKVMHPNVKKEISDACNYYKEVKTSLLFPGRFVTICDLFFQDLKKQLEMNREFKNGKRYKQMMQPNPDGNYIVVVPEMIDVSKKCLVMSYEESILAANVVALHLDKHIMMKMCEVIFFTIFSNIISGFVHLDLHAGNFGIQNHESRENMKIVIYDFGQMANVSNVKKDIRIKIATSELLKNKYDLITSFLGNKIATDFLKTIDADMYFDDAILKMAHYIMMNNVKIDDGINDIMVSMAKTKYTADLACILTEMDGMEEYTFQNTIRLGYAKYIQEYHPYDEFKELALQFE